MLPKKNRLVLSKRNQNKSENKLTNRYFVLKYKGSDHFKAAVVVSKKTAKKSVDRNRIRRLVTEALSDLKPAGLEIIIIVRENIAEQKAGQVKTSLEALLKKI